MRVIVCDDESMEPITVIELGLAELRGWEREGRLGCVRVAAPRVPEPPGPHETVPTEAVMDIVELRIVRREDLWVAVTKQGERALQLDAALLPGQRRALALAPWVVS